MGAHAILFSTLNMGFYEDIPMLWVLMLFYLAPSTWVFMKIYLCCGCSCYSIEHPQHGFLGRYTYVVGAHAILLSTLNMGFYEDIPMLWVLMLFYLAPSTWVFMKIYLCCGCSCYSIEHPQHGFLGRYTYVVGAHAILFSTLNMGFYEDIPMLWVLMLFY